MAPKEVIHCQAANKSDALMSMLGDVRTNKHFVKCANIKKITLILQHTMALDVVARISVCGPLCLTIKNKLFPKKLL